MTEKSISRHCLARLCDFAVRYIKCDIPRAYGIQYIAMKEIITERPDTRFTSHKLTMTDRKSASLSGVCKVESSNATEIAIVTCLGRMVITGTELKIDRFDTAVGDMSFTGNIDSIKYTAQKQPLLKRIFK